MRVRITKLLGVVANRHLLRQAACQWGYAMVLGQETCGFAHPPGTVFRLRTNDNGFGPRRVFSGFVGLPGYILSYQQGE